MYDAAAIQNAKGDNSQVFSKKEIGSVRQKVKKGKKESLKIGEKREDANLKLVPLHINDVIDALKHVKRSSLTSIIRNCNRMKREHSNAGKFSAKYRKFHPYEEFSDADHHHADKESIISDFVEELNIRYVRKCESDIRKRKMKRKRAVGHWQPKKRSQQLIRDTKLSEKSKRARNKFSSFKNGDRSSLTGLSYLPEEQKIDGKHRKKEQKFKIGDFDRLSDVNFQSGKKIHSKSYTACKEKDIYGYPKERKYAGVYSSKSQESTYKVATTKKRILRKNREHGRRERTSGKRGKTKIGRDNSWSSGERLKENLTQKLKEMTLKDKAGKKEILENGEQMRQNNKNSGNNLSGNSLADKPNRNFMERNHNTFSNPNCNYTSQGINQSISGQYINNYQKVTLKPSPNDNKDRTNSDMTHQFKFQANFEKNFQTNEIGSRGSQSNLIAQNSKIIIKIQTSQTRMTASNSRYCAENQQDSAVVENLTDGGSINIIPSDTFNKRYRKNRLNGNFGILSRISVPDFHQKEVLTAKNFQRPKSSRLQLAQTTSEEKPSNDPLKNIMLTRLVKQNSSMSVQENCKEDARKKYVLGELSSDAYSHPMNISDLCSSQSPNLAPLSDPISYATETSTRQEDSDSSLSESVIIETMSRKQNETKQRKSRTERHYDESTDEETHYRRSGLPFNLRKMPRANKNKAYHHRHKEQAEKRLKSPVKNPSNEESTAYPTNQSNDNEDVNLKSGLKGKKCAVKGCNKHAVIDTEKTVPQNKHYLSLPTEKNGGDGSRCPQKKTLDSASSHKMCVMCTAPLKDQNIRGGLLPDSINCFPEVPENLISLMNNTPYFASPSQEDFQRYLAKMQRCFSAQSPSHHMRMKKYRSQPITTSNARNQSPDKYYSLNYWEPENYGHTQRSCVDAPFSNRDNFVYYCTEETGAPADYTPTNMNFEPFPFMQSTGPLMDTNGRPLLILDERGQPILDYNGQPITPETYAHVGYRYDPGFHIDDSLIHEEINQSKKFSCFGFH